MFNLEAYLRERRQTIEAALDQRLPAATERPTVLHKAMRYSVMAGGKRVRPVLCLAACEASGVPPETALVPALALEVLHTYTLVHDDLPCMDDDELRRGQPTAHVVFGEANALLAGDALLTLAFDWLSTVTAPPPYPANQLSRELAEAAGSRGVIAGQVEDLAAEGKPHDADLLEFIHRHKTTALIRAAVRMGAICAAASARALAALTAYGENVGLAFQIADDILNATAETAILGKPTRTDAAHKKLTYVAMHGLEPSRARAQALVQAAVRALSDLPGDAQPLAALAHYTAQRAA
jgi:geranylgeranyl diphosphate synthase, type II